MGRVKRAWRGGREEEIRSAKTSIRLRTGRVKDRRCPQFCRRLHAAARRFANDKIGTPVARWRGRFAVLDPARPPPGEASSFARWRQEDVD
jgi:hypothetical protein